MGKLNTASNLKGHDDLYQLILGMQNGLSEEQARKADAKLILLLANHIGDVDVIVEAINAATNTATKTV